MLFRSSDLDLPQQRLEAPADLLQGVSSGQFVLSPLPRPQGCVVVFTEQLMAPSKARKSSAAASKASATKGRRAKSAAEKAEAAAQRAAAHQQEQEDAERISGVL